MNRLLLGLAATSIGTFVTPAQAGQEVLPIALTDVSGALGPGESNRFGNSTFSSFGSAAINHAGQVAFTGGYATFPSGIWRYTQGLDNIAIFNGELVPATPEAPTSADGYLFDDAGNIAFRGINGLGFGNNTAIFRTTGGGTSLSTVVRTGTDGVQGPGFGAGVEFSLALNGLTRPTAFRNGNLVIEGELTGTGINFNNDDILIRATESGNTVVARNGVASPDPLGPNVNTNSFQNGFASNAVNNNGDILSLAALNIGSFGSGVQFIAPGDGSGNDIIAQKSASGALGPGVPSSPNSRFTFLAGAGTSNINDTGEVVFTGRLGTSRPNVIVRHNNDVNTAVVLLTDTAPGTATPFNDFSPSNSPVIAGNGDIFFPATVAHPTIAGRFKHGLWRQQDGIGTDLIALDGDALGLAEDTYFSDLHSVAANASGNVAFYSQLIGTDVNGSNDAAIVAYIDDVLQLVVREGDMLDIDPTDGEDLRIVEAFKQEGSLSNSGGQDGRRTYFNDADQLVATIAFTDGTEGVFLFDLSVPEPTSLALLGLGGLMALRRRR